MAAAASTLAPVAIRGFDGREYVTRPADHERPRAMAAVAAYMRLVDVVEDGDLDEVRAALSAGAQPDFMAPDGEDTGNARLWGLRPLYVAAQTGQCEILSVAKSSQF